ncbi:AAA family ATPase [Clavibacter zhangzhiyongii]|uniref:AAA family ATPase n=1 Tax=Clavibacter zhangzhiyongii TaxID=2768071 RepID=UPI00195DC763|nr:AAA family ATPase [Clavibacter zhangzhiyongii]MBM7026014.1 AAA family ATPase [Clavibacter zhangzhiyongii]
MHKTRSSTFRDTVVDLVRARHPVLLVESHESDRVVDMVLTLSSAPELKRPRRVLTYTMSSGLHSPGDRKGKVQSPQDALASLADAQEPTIFVFFDLHHSLGSQSRSAEPATIRAILDVAAAFRSGDVPHTLIIVSPALQLPLDLEKVVTVVDLPLPGQEEVALVLDDIIAANSASITVNLSDEERQRLVQAAQGLTLVEAENAYARAIASDRVLDASDISLVLDEKRQTIRKSGLLEFMTTTKSLDEVGGLDNLKAWLAKRNGSWLEEAAAWGIPSPKGVLITGVPGCGKSLTATCMSTAWGLPLLRLDVGRIFAGLVGSSEENMRRALKLAEAVSPCILWIDEIEKGFGSSGAGDSGTSSRVLGTFLTWMQEKKSTVFVVATANKIDALPPEFLRKGRFDEIFFVDLPTFDERLHIWDLHLTERLSRGAQARGNFALDDVTVRNLAAMSEGFSGAEIAQSVIAACFDAFAERRAVAVSDFESAITNTVPLSVTQGEQIRSVRDWAASRAVAATSSTLSDGYSGAPESPESAVAAWRGGRRIDF